MDITLFKETLDAISLFDWFFFLFVFFRQRKKKNFSSKPRNKPEDCSHCLEDVQFSF